MSRPKAPNGPARELCLLHGYTQGPQSWARVIARLPPGLEARALTLPGHSPEHPVRPGDFSAAIEAVAAQITAEAPIDLVAYSLGARVALGLLITQPHRVRRATLIGANPGLADPAERRARRQTDEAWALLLEQDGIIEFERRWQAQPIFATQNGIEPALRDEQHALRLSHSASQLALAMRQMSLAVMPSYWEALSEVEMPVQLITGDRDEKFSAIAQRMVDRMPNAVWHSILGAGHNVPLEASEALSERLVSFHQSANTL